MKKLQRSEVFKILDASPDVEVADPASYDALKTHGPDAELFFLRHTVRDDETGLLRVNPSDPITPQIARDNLEHLRALDEAGVSQIIGHDGILRHEITSFAIVLDAFSKLETM